MKYGKKIAILCSVVFLMILTACGNKTTNGAAGKSDTMYIGLVNPPVSFNPINSSDIAAAFLEKFMFNTFLEMDGPLKFSSKLAESFTTQDDMTYTVKINKDAKWSDGKPVTADDAIYTMNLVTNPKTETAVGSYFTILDGLDANGKLKNGETENNTIKKIDDKTFSFKTKLKVDPNMVKEQIGSKFMILPKHVLEKVKPEDLSKDPFMMKPTVTNGPYKFVQYKKDQYVQYVANDDYYAGKPKVKNLYVKIMPASNMVAQLQTGELDMNAGGGIGKIPAQDFATVQKFKNVKTSFDSTYGYQLMEFNVDKLKSAKLRQAIAYALNRQEMVDKLLDGHGEVVDGPYTSVSPYLDKNLKTYSFDLEKAKQLVKESGWDTSKTINLVVPTGNKVREQSADIITQNLKAAGLKINVTKYDFPTIMSKAKKGDYDLLLIGFTLTLDPDVSVVYASNGSSSYSNYNSQESDALLEKGKTESDDTKRKEIYNQLQALWEKDVPMLTLYSDQDFSAVSKRVEVGGPKVFGFHKDLQEWSLTGAK